MSATGHTDTQATVTPGQRDWPEERKQFSASEYRVNDPRRKSAFLAGFLSLLPGLGQVYVGYYRQGFLNIVIAGSVFSFLASTQGSTPLTPLGVLFLIFFEFYNVIDGARRASLYNLALEGVEEIDLPDRLTDQPITLQGSFVFGGLLMLFGLVALSNTLFGFSLQWLENWWPIAPLALGAYLFYKAYAESQRQSG